MHPLPRPVAVLAGALLVLTGCAQPEPVTSDVPLPELAATAEPESEPSPAGASGDAAASPTPETPGSPASGPTEPAAETPEGPTDDDASAPAGPGDDPDSPDDPGEEGDAAASPRELVVATDRAGDAGLEGPDWADLVGIRLVDTGPDLAVTVTLADVVPATLAEREVVGIGIDIFETGAAESAYQLFVDGGSDGWRAYLQTPDGFVEYPGSFRIVGARLELGVPWPAVGGPREGEVSVFLDWSRRAVVTNLVARDDLPDRGRVGFAR